MPQPYDYTTRRADIGGYFDAMRQGRTDRLATEDETRRNALAKYLPGALEGDQGMQRQALEAAPLEMMPGLKESFAKLKDAEFARLRDNQKMVAARAYAAKTPEQWAQVNAYAKTLDPNAPDIPFEMRDQVIAQSQTLDSLMDQEWKERSFKLDESRTRAQNAASYASAAASNALAGQRGTGGGVDLTNADKREIFETDEMVGANKTAINLLQQAKELSKRSLQGPGAATVGEITALFGDTEGENTVEFDNLLQQQALPQLKAIFGGMPTEGERKVLLQLQGSARLPRKIREKIIDTATDLARARLKFNQEKAAGLRTGTYYTNAPSFDLPSPPARPDQNNAASSPTKNGMPIVRTQAEFDALPSGTVYVEPDGKRYRKP